MKIKEMIIEEDKETQKKIFKLEMNNNELKLELQSSQETSNDSFNRESIDPLLTSSFAIFVVSHTELSKGILIPPSLLLNIVAMLLFPRISNTLTNSTQQKGSKEIIPVREVLSLW